MRLLGLLLLLIGLPWAQGTDLTMEATGYGATKNEAINSAKREALAQGIGQMLVSQTEVENFMVKRDYILTQTQGHVKSYTVIKELQGPDGAWEVRVKAVVSKDGLSKDLAALMVLKESIGNPRIALLIKEINMGNEDPTSNKTEALLIDFFKSKTFEVVDPSAALRFRDTPEGIKAMAMDADAAAKLGSALGADVVIVGTVVSKESDVSQISALAKSGMKSASSNISLKAIQVSNRRIMAAKAADAPAVHVNQHTAGYMAIEKAVNKMMSGKAGFFDALVESWRQGANDGTIIALEVNGVSSFGTAKAVRAAIQAQVTKLDQRGFQNPKLQLDAVFGGTTEDLCEKLEGLDIKGSGKLAVTSYESGTIKLQLK